MPDRKRVILFKKKDLDDKYHTLLSKNGFDTEFIPVLDHKLVNIDAIKSIIQNGPTTEQLCAMILTSQRSVQAINEAYNEIISLDPHVRDEWNSMPIYIVGPQTADALGRVPLFRDNHHCHHWTVAPRASELIKSFTTTTTTLTSTVLFLAGDKRHDMIPEALSAAHIPLRELCSYVTCAHPDLGNRLPQAAADWAVYFSPSGLKFLLDHHHQPHILATTKIASIGPTTSHYIANELGLHVDIQAEEPDAEHLVNAMVRYYNK